MIGSLAGHLAGHEVRRCGVPAPVTLTAVAAAAAVVLAVSPSRWTGQAAMDVVALALGMGAAAVAGGETALELHLTLPTPYPRTVRRRLTVLVVPAVIALAGLAAVLVATGSGDRLSVLADAASLGVLLFGTGVYAVVALGAVGAASSVVLTVWLAKLFVLDRVLPGSALAAVVAAAAGVVLLVAARRRMAAPELPAAREVA